MHIHTHTLTTPFKQICAYKSERNKKGARLPVAQLVFHKLDQETTQRLLHKLFGDNYDKQPNQILRTAACKKKSFITFSRVQLADHSRSVVYISILLPLSHD